jgi:hypothetical protein
MAMRRANAINFFAVGGFVGVAALALVTLALMTFAPPKAQATPEMAKATGKACTACHTAMPPTKENAKPQ